MTEIFIYSVIDKGGPLLQVDCRMSGSATTLLVWRNKGLHAFSSGPREVELDGLQITKVKQP